MLTNDQPKAVVQYYNRSNAGDDLLVRVLVDRFEGGQFLVPTRDGNSSLADRGNVTPLTRSFARRGVEFLQHRVPALRSGKNNVQLERASRNADALIHIGGSIFIEHPNSQDHWKRERDYYRRLRVPYYILDANFGPFISESYPSLVKDILAGAADVCVRDEATFNRFQDLANIRLAPDAAFATPSPPRGERAESTVSISVMSFSKTEPERHAAYEAQLAAFVRERVRAGQAVRLLSFCAFQGDLDAAQRIRQSANLSENETSRVSVHDYRGDLDALLSEIADSDLIVGTRFHATVLGLTFGVPTLPIAYSAKTTNMLRSIGVESGAQSLASGHELDLDPSRAVMLSVGERAALRRAADGQFDGLVSTFGEALHRE